MGLGLLSENKVELGVVAFADVNDVIRKDVDGIKQWLFPVKYSYGINGLPSDKLLKKIVNIVDIFEPDLIHIWGTESFWGLVSSRKYFNQNIPVLLEMQGMKKAISRYFAADLSTREMFACVGIKEIIKREIIVTNRKTFLKWGAFEEEVIKNHCYIDVQSNWMSAYVKSINQNAVLFYVDLSLRTPFYHSKPWSEFISEREEISSPYIFISSSGSAPYKGIHVAIRVLAEIKNRYPNMRLHIAGSIQRIGIRQEGYIRWVNRLSKKFNVSNSIDWLGPMSDEEMVKELQYCSVNLVCSFVESYCLALAEAMYLGVPCVTTFTGGTSWIAKNNTNALFYPPGDVVMCAGNILSILDDSTLANNLSIRARRDSIKRHNLQSIISRQMQIYNSVISNWQ